MKKKIICFDIDGIICNTIKGNYIEAKPIKKNIILINKLFKKNYKIILFTARFMGRCNGNIDLATKKAKMLTLAQLKKWKVNYDDIFFGKPSYDLIIDDKMLGFKKNWTKKMNFLMRN